MQGLIRKKIDKKTVQSCKKIYLLFRQHGLASSSSGATACEISPKKLKTQVEKPEKQK